MKIGLYSHVSRRLVRERTLAEFGGVGVEVDFVHEQEAAPSQINNRLSGATALRGAFRLAEPGEPVMTMEDDLIPSPYLAEWLAWLEADMPNGVISLYSPGWTWLPKHLHRVGRDTRLEFTPRSQVVECRDPTLYSWWGAQALVFPRHLAADALSHAKMTEEVRGWGPYDWFWRGYMKEREVPLFMVVPNVVQHRRVSNLVISTKPPHRSLLYRPDARPPRKE